MSTQETISVKTMTGIYKGLKHNGVHIFRGIHYALAPEGALRFSAPIPVAHSKEIKDATKFSMNALQQGLLAIHSGENCLSLNIWNKSDSKGNRPVLFYIHGGTFIRGSGSEALYDGSNLARKHDIVVVSINYRLGALGFLDFSSMDENCVANPALHDVITALKWTHDNIECFGGLSSNITVMGESAGGTLASLLPSSDQAMSLFSKLVLMSGVPTSLLNQSESNERSHKFLEEFQLNSVCDLFHVSPEFLVSATSIFMKTSGHGSLSFQPSIDHHHIQDFPTALIKGGFSKTMPMLLGNTLDELSIMEHPLLKNHWDFSPALDNGFALEDDQLIKKIQSEYDALYEKKESRIQFFSDVLFKLACLFYGEAASQASPVWYYRFDYCPPRMKHIRLGAFHSSDLPLIFGNFHQGVGKMMFGFSSNTSEAESLSIIMQKDLTTFMQSGNLPWENLSCDTFIAKVYDHPIHFDSPIPENIYQLYKQTNYYKRTMNLMRPL